MFLATLIWKELKENTKAYISFLNGYDYFWNA